MALSENQENKINKKIKKLPDEPGVYFFYINRKIAYIGKATSLRNRVKSYFSADIGEKRGPLIEKMMAEELDVKFIKTDSVLEALLLEAELIRKHLPDYNTLGKDQKSFNYVVITKEQFPQVLVVRGRELEARIQDLKLQATYGPFPSGFELREAMKIIRRIFPYRDYKCTPGQGRPCFNYEIGLCPGTCVGTISEEDYKKTVRNIKLFFMGKKKTLVKNLERDMKTAAKAREFEQAEKIKHQIFSLKHINDIALVREKYANTRDVGRNESFRIEAYDISHTAGTNIVGVMTVVEDGEVKKSDYRMFKIRGQKGADDTRALTEVLERRLKHLEWRYPDLIVVDGGQGQYNALEKILNKLEKKNRLVSVVKNMRHKPKDILGDQKIAKKYKKEILLANSESHRFAIKFHRKRRSIF